MYDPDSVPKRVFAEESSNILKPTETESIYIFLIIFL